jgi:uracil-DNA glycosylase family 4
LTVLSPALTPRRFGEENEVKEAHQPSHDCPLCPRLEEFRARNKAAFPEFFNAPVPSFGPMDAKLLIVGLAPGLKGANRTGRPFTGDYAGDLLYGSLTRHGLTRGTYGARPDDGFELVGARIVNSVRCVPPENKPLPVEVNTCRQFLIVEMATMTKLRAVLTLGKVAHDSVATTLKLKKKDHVFKHGARHDANGLAIFASYHCSRYNTNTGVLTEAMFDSVVAAAKQAAGL